MNQYIILFIFILVVVLVYCIFYKFINRTVKIFAGGVEFGKQNFRVVNIGNAISDGIVEFDDELGGKSTIHNTKSNKYRSWKTDEQIKTIARNGNPDEFSRMIKLVTKYFPYSDRGNIVKSFYHKRDSEIYHSIKLDRSEEDRGHFHAQEMFRGMVKFLKAKGLKEIPSDTYLDVGCGDGSITKHFAEFLGAKEVHCIEPKDPPAEVAGLINYHKPPSSPAAALPFPDNHFDVITAFMSLHHITEIDATVKELYRVMKPGGFLFIKEHDCWNAYDAMIVDIEHCIFINALEGKSTVDMDDVVSHYKNYYGWDETLKPFKWIHADFYYGNLRNEINPSRTYLAVYQKVEENKKE